MRRPSVVVSKMAQSVVRHLHPAAKKSIRNALDKLRTNPYEGKPLTEELEGLWSLPVARHRIIYQIDTRRITVVYIGPRRDIYETLRELLTQ